MMLVRQVRVLLIAAAVVAVASCDIVGPGEPLVNPGPVDVILASPRTDDGALMFTVTGGAVDSASALTYGLFMSQTGPDSYRIIVSGDLVSGPVARVWLPDRNAIAPYTLSIEEVAARVTYLQQSTDGYRLTFIVP